MSSDMNDLWLVLLIIGWYGGMWFIAWDYQLLKGFGKDSRVGHAPDWLVLLCGMRGKPENLHLPYAMGQVAAILALIVSIALVLILPANNLRRYLLTYMTAIPFLSLALGHVVMGIRRVLHRPQ